MNLIPLLSMIRTYSENELVALLQVHDTSAFAYLYGFYKDAVYGMILEFLPPALAADVSQEVFIVVWNKFETYDPAKGRLFTWLRAITKNTCIDIIRSPGYRGSLQTDGLSGADNYFGSIREPEVVTDGSLHKAVNNLSTQHRTLITLVYLHGYTRQQIGCMQGIPVSTVKTRLRRALTALRKQLANEAVTINAFL